MMEMHEIIRVAEQGVTKPLLCKGQDGILYWCKGDFAGLASCRNEWICACLAKELNLSIPNFHIARIPWRLFNAWKMVHPEAPNVISESNPYVFASQYINTARDIVARKDVEIIPEHDQTMVLLFDEFVRNMDRTDSNSNLLMTAAKKWFVIDHNLSYDVSFERSKFIREHILKNVIYCAAYQDKEKFEAQIKAVFTAEFLEDVWGKMPEQWVSDDSAEEHKKRIMETIKGG